MALDTALAKRLEECAEVFDEVASHTSLASEETFEETVGDAYEDNMRKAHARNRALIEDRIRHLQQCLDDLPRDKGGGEAVTLPFLQACNRRA